MEQTNNFQPFSGVGTPSFAVGGATTPQSAVFTPNTPLHIAYGGNPMVATGKFSNNAVQGTQAGTIFNPSIGAQFNQKGYSGVTSGGGVAPDTQNGTNATGSINMAGTKPDLSQYILNNVTTATGGNVTTDANGNVVNHSLSPFNIDTSGNVDSSYLGSNTSGGDVYNNAKNYQDYVNAVAQAQGYSPAYLAALQQQYQTQAQGAYLGSQSAALNANLATGSGFAGSTIGEGQAQTGIQQNLLTQQQALNTQQETQASIALNAQQLARTGNIAAAQTQLQYNPTAITGQNAIAQWQQYSQQYPGVVPAYDQSLSPAQNALNAQQAVQSSPQFKSQYQQTYTTPGGGLGIYNKLGTNLLNTNADGTISLVSGAEAALGSANAGAVNDLTKKYNDIAVPYNAAKADYDAMTQFMQKANLNNSSIRLVNQVENAVKSGILAPGAVSSFKTYIASIRANYAALLAARTGSVAGVNAEADSLVSDNLSIPDLMKVRDALKTNGQNMLDSTQKQLQDILSQLPGAAGISSSQGGLSTPTSSWPGWSGK